MNEITVIGKVGQAPELRFTNNGMAVCTFSVATNRRTKNSEEKETTWHDCTAFDKLAENIAGSLTKGNEVIVIGRLEKRKYEKKDGTKAEKVSIVVDNCGLSLRWDCATVGAEAVSGAINVMQETFFKGTEEPF
jgi:single-strand DNA-binding protein